MKGVDAPDLAAQQLKKEVERNVTPPLEVTVDVMRSQGVPILRALIPNGPEKPYALGQTRVDVREEGETTEAVRDELVQLVLQGRKLVEAAQATEIVAQPEVVAPEEPVKAETEAGRAPARSRPRPPQQRPGATPAPVETPHVEAPVSLPTIGVEVVSMEERKGGRYYAIRDLRNGNVVQNVTIHSAWKLWSYAINQQLTHPERPGECDLARGPGPVASRAACQEAAL